MPNSVSNTPPPSPDPSKSTQNTSSSPSGGAPPNPSSSNDYEAGLAVWQKFLSVGGHQATREQAKQFMSLVMKALGDYIQQCNTRMVAAIKKMQKDQDDLQ
jgi:hypothetical protein